MRPKDGAKAREILAAALHEVAEHGLAGLSIEAVARRAGVATGTVYVYHRSKEALLEAVYLAYASDIARVFAAFTNPAHAASAGVYAATSRASHPAD